MGAAPSQRMSCVWSCLKAAGSTGADTKVARMYPPHHRKPLLSSCGAWVELQNVPWERKPKPDSANINQISPRSQGKEVSVPWAIARTAAGLAPSNVVPVPCWPQALVSLLGLVQQPPALLCSPTCHQMVFFRAHHAQRLICAQRHMAQKLALGCLRGFEAGEESSQSASAPWPHTGGMSPLTSSAFGSGPEQPDF